MFKKNIKIFLIIFFLASFLFGETLKSEAAFCDGKNPGDSCGQYDEQICIANVKGVLECRNKTASNTIVADADKKTATVDSCSSYEIYSSQCDSGEKSGSQAGCSNEGDELILDEQCKCQYGASSCGSMSAYLSAMSNECKQKKPDGIDCDMIAKNNIYGREAAKFAAYKKSNSPVVKKDDTAPSVVPPIVSREPIVPCGTDSPCTLCHFIVGIKKLVDYGIYLVTTMAFVGIFIGGAMYMISSGDSAMIESAKKFIGASVLGFALVLGAWLIVNIIFNILPIQGVYKTNWHTFSCSTVSTAGSGKNDVNSSGSGGSTSGTVNDKKVPCGDGNRGTCWTNTAGICPSGYRRLSGGTSCTSKSEEGFTLCCIADSKLINENGSIGCGEGNKGTCWTNTAGFCPDDWISYDLYDVGTMCLNQKTKDGSNAGITKCCIKKESTTGY